MPNIFRFFPNNSIYLYKSPTITSEIKYTFLSLFLLQVIASTVKNFLLLDLGLSVAFPSIVIPALTGFPNEFNQNEQLSMSPSEASWFGMWSKRLPIKNKMKISLIVFALLVSNEPIHNSKSLINKHCLIMKTFVISSSYKYVYKRPGKELLRLFTT